MKPKMLKLFVIPLVVFGILAGQGFSATAPQKPKTRHISEDIRVDGAGWEQYRVPSRVSIKYPTVSTKLTCEDIQPEVGIVIQHDQIGDTWYDFQKNGSMGRMISVTSGGYRHVSWMYTDHEYPPGPRYVDANCKDPSGTYFGQVHADGDYTPNNAGYSNQTHLHDGTSVIIAHRTAGTPTWWTTLTIDDDVCGGFFTQHWDLPDYIENNTSGQDGAWPKADVLYCTDETVWPNALDYIHIVLTEGNTDPVPVMIGYERCYLSPTNGDTVYCETYLSNGRMKYAIKKNQAGAGTFAPISHFDSSCSVTPVVVVSPVSRRVAVAYLSPNWHWSCDYVSDCCWIESMDNGNEWLLGAPWPPTINNITNFGCSSTERCYHDVSACYDYNDSLHIVYLTCGFDPEQPGYYQPGVGRLYHWSKKDGTSQIHGKLQGGTDPGAHNCILAKMSVSAKDPIYHPGGDSVYLFCIFTEFDSSDNSASDLSNGDIMGTGSFDGGKTWGGIFNLTNTQTPGCTPGNCVSEHWSSLAQNMYDGDLHIDYVCDLDAGGAIQDNTQWMANPVMYLHLTEWEVSAEARSSYRIDQPTHWYHPPLKVTPGGSRTLIFKVFSIGNACLVWSASSAHECIYGTGSGTLQPRDSATVTLVVDGGGMCSGTFIDAIVELTTNEGEAGITYTLPVQAVVADDYYECPKDPQTVDTLYNGILLLAVNANCGEQIRDSATVADTALDIFFLGGTIIATTSGTDTLVGRYMHEDRHAGARDKLVTDECDVDWEPDFWLVYTKDIFIHNLEPPADYKWYWWEMSKQIKFFKETAPDDYKRLVIKYVKVSRHDPPYWWPDQTPFSSYDDTYIGVAEDIDCPWDSADTDPPTPWVNGEENATNLGGYDAVNHIAWQQGYGNDEHPSYSNYYCGIALTNSSGAVVAPYGSYCVKNNYYLYPNGGWGWKDQELYNLAATPNNTIQDQDSLVDRSYVVTAAKIDAGSDPNREASFTVLLASAPNGLSQLQALIDTGRAIVERESAHGLPAWLCGDADGDGSLGLGDITYLQQYLYGGGPPPCPPGKADVDNDGSITEQDIQIITDYLFSNCGWLDCPGIEAPPPLAPCAHSPFDLEAESDTLGVYLNWSNPQTYEVIYVYCQTDTVTLIDMLIGSPTDYFYTPDEPGVYCYFLKGERYGVVSPYSEPACASFTTDNFLGVPSAVTWDDSALAYFHVLNCYEPGGYTPDSYQPTSYTPGSYEPTIPGDCDSGFFWDPSSGLCWQECAPNFFWDENDRKCRENCSVGYFWDDDDNLCREECSAGFFWDQDDNLCRQECASGYDWYEDLNQCCERAKDNANMAGTEWAYGNSTYGPGPLYLGWGTNLQQQWYDNNSCTQPLIGAIVAVPSSQPPGGSRVYVKHWFRTADSNDRLLVVVRDRIQGGPDITLTPTTDGLGFAGYYNGVGNNACATDMPGFAMGDGSFAWSRFDIPGSLNGKKLSIKFILGSDGSGNQGPGGEYTGWFLNKAIYIGMDLHRGDADCNGAVDGGDLVYIINYLFRDGPTTCVLGTYGRSGDVNCDGEVGPGDIVYLINYLYRNDSPPPCPP
jgi:hypothetical protein